MTVRRVTFPVQVNNPQHRSWWGPAYLQGTWEDTGKPCPIISLAGTVAFWEEHVWICKGGSEWAYVNPDGKIQGFVHYTMPRTCFTEAKRLDVTAIAPVPMTTLPPQPTPYNGIRYSTVLEHAKASMSGNPAGKPTATSSPTTHGNQSSRWNGTCPRCGRGTYTGAWDVEHEGGPCQS